MDRDEKGKVIIRTIDDVRRAVSIFNKDSSSGKVELSTKFEFEDKGKKNYVDVSSYSSDFDYRGALLEGFNQVKMQKEMWDRLRNTLNEDEYAASLPEVDIDKIVMSVDQLIRHNLDGIREGLTVVWNIDNKKIIYDPYGKDIKIMENV